MTRTSLAEAYYNRLPQRPYASNAMKEYGLDHYAKRYAINRKFIQTNPPNLRHSLVFDIDHENSYECWESAGLPVPNIWIGNPANGKGHAVYVLSTPICTGRNARPQPIAFADAITDAFTMRLRADPNYTGFIAKNPLSEAWKTAWLHGLTFSLNVLAEYVDLTQPPANDAILVGGRNCTLFDQLRLWAYNQVQSFNGHYAWSAAVLNQATRLNTFRPKLPYSEVKATAKSVAKWVWNHGGHLGTTINRGRDGHGISRHDGYDRKSGHWTIPKIGVLEAPELRRRQQLAAFNTHAQRKLDTRERVEQSMLFIYDQHGIVPSIRQLAEISGVSFGSVSRHYRDIKKASFEAD